MCIKRASAQGKNALMDSFNYMKYFLDRTLAEQGFPDSRKNTIISILTAKEIMAGRANWANTDDKELAKISSLISKNPKVLKAAYLLGISDILSHVEDLGWITKKPDSELAKGKSRIELMNDFYDRLNSEKIERDNYSDFFKDAFELMSENCLKASPDNF